MRSEDLSALLRIRRGDVHSVCSRVLAQNKPSLEPDEEAFLREHRGRLDAVQLARWLAFRPENSAPIVRSLCEKLASESEVLLWHVLRWRGAIEHDAWAELTHALSRTLSPDASRALAYGLRGCSVFDAIVRAEQSLLPAERSRASVAALAIELIEARYDPAGCEKIARSLATRRDETGAYVRAVLVHAKLEAWIDERERAGAIAERRAFIERASERSQRAPSEHAPAALDASALFDERELDAMLPSAPAAPRDETRFDRARIDWLTQHGAARRDLVALSLDRLASGTLIEDDARTTLRWLAEQLQTRSAWEQHGPLVLDRLLSIWRWDPIGRLVAFLDDVAVDPEQPQLLLRASPPPWTPALHEALARVILARVEASFEAHDHRRAHALLEALVQLELPPRLYGALRALLRVPEAQTSAESPASTRTDEPPREASASRQAAKGTRDARSTELLELHGQLCRRGAPEVATIDGAIAALRDLAVLEAL